MTSSSCSTQRDVWRHDSRDDISWRSRAGEPLLIDFCLGWYFLIPIYSISFPVAWILSFANTPGSVAGKAASEPSTVRMTLQKGVQLKCAVTVSAQQFACSECRMQITFEHRRKSKEQKQLCRRRRRPPKQSRLEWVFFRSSRETASKMGRAK
jgi:hypothetical protein